MSLLVVEKTDAKKHKNKIIIGKTSKQLIYYDNTVKKSDRVRMVELDEMITPIPYLDVKNNQRSASFISGISGSGKTTLMAKLVAELRKIDGGKKDKRTNEIIPKKVVFFTASKLENRDPVLDTIDNLAFVPLDHPEFLMIGLDNLKDTICVFDDYENVANKELAKYVVHFLKDLLERSRKLNVSIIIINHLTQNYNKTRNIINECTDYYLNISSNRNSALRFLKSYFDFDKKEIDAIKNYEFDNPFSWCLFRKSVPSYTLIENTIKLI